MNLCTVIFIIWSSDIATKQKRINYTTSPPERNGVEDTQHRTKRPNKERRYPRDNKNKGSS